MELIVETRKFAELSSADLDNWLAIVNRNGALASPYFHPLFAECCARAGRNVQVTIIESATGPAFLPYEMISRGQAGPLGGVMGDFHGIVACADHGLVLPDLVRLSGLKSFAFDHLLCDGGAPPDSIAAVSPAIEMPDGYDAYRQQKIDEKSKLFKKIDKYKRDLVKQLGPLRFDHHSEDGELLGALVKLKTEQYQRSGIMDLFSFGWPLALLGEIFKVKEADFRGSLSCLYAGDEMVFLHFGMQTNRRFHYWYPAYPIEHSRLSPGIVGLDFLARAVAEDGITAIDLGKGDNLYKSRFANAELTIYEGQIVPSDITRLKNDLLQKLGTTVKQSPLLHRATFPVRWLTRRYRHGKRYR